MAISSYKIPTSRPETKKMYPTETNNYYILHQSAQNLIIIIHNY